MRKHQPLRWFCKFLTFSHMNSGFFQTNWLYLGLKTQLVWKKTEIMWENVKNLQNHLVGRHFSQQNKTLGNIPLCPSVPQRSLLSWSSVRMRNRWHLFILLLPFLSLNLFLLLLILPWIKMLLDCTQIRTSTTEIQKRIKFLCNTKWHSCDT